MRAIAGDPANLQFGKEVINQKLAINTFAAVAAVFARIAYSDSHEGSLMINGTAWICASHKAMTLAGATDYETKEAVNELYHINRRNDPLRDWFEQRQSA